MKHEQEITEEEHEVNPSELIVRELANICNTYRELGCSGCPFNPELQKDLNTMEKLLPNKKKQCEIIWKPVYAEYRRLQSNETI